MGLFPNVEEQAMPEPTMAATGSELPRIDDSAAAPKTNFAFEQTQMSADRTLMATVRTALSLISFGFTIYQLLGRASAVFPRASITARNLGLALLILGLSTLAMGVTSHALYSRELARRRDRPHEAVSSARAVFHEMAAIYASALGLLFIGLAALAALLIRSVR